jgi:hypothetical protein
MFVGTSLDYKEYDNKGVLFDSEESSYGDITGFELGYGYTFKTKERFFTKIDFGYTYTSGESKYTGSILGSDEPYGSLKSITNNTITEYTLQLKEIYVLNDRFNLKFGMGIGYYEWDRTLSVIQNEIYSWYPLRFDLGSSFRIDPRSPLSFDVNFAYKMGLSPQMEAEELGLTFDLGGVDCYELSLYGMYGFNKYIYLVGGFVYNFQDIERSETKEGYFEPDSKDRQRLVKLGLQVSF